MAHLRTVVDNGELDSPSLTTPYLWAIHLSADLFTEVHSGQLTSCVDPPLIPALLIADTPCSSRNSTMQDQLLLAGPDPVSYKEVEERYRKAIAEKGQWPDISPCQLASQDC